MPSSNVEVVEIGIPGPPGSGVTAAEKATYVTLSGTNVFTGNTDFTPAANDANSFRLRDAASVTTMRHSSATRTLQFMSGALLKGYSDVVSTEKWSIDSATGNAQFDGYVQADGGIRGDSVYLKLLTIDGGGSTITTGVKDDFVVPYNFVPLEWLFLADVSGSISIELWKDTYANYPPTPADLVTGTTGTNNPRISSSNKGFSTSLTNWNVSTWTIGDTVRVNVVSATTITRAALHLKVNRV